MITPLALGTNHMLGQDAYVPLTTNNFEIRIYGMNGSDPTENANLLTLATDQIGEIAENQDVITVHYGNGVIKFPSKVSFNDVEWTLNCYCAPNVLGALREWKEQVYNPETEKMGLPGEYMRNVYFIKYNGRGDVQDIIKCPGTFITALQNGEMNQQGGDVVKVRVTLVISKAIYMKEADFF